MGTNSGATTGINNKPIGGAGGTGGGGGGVVGSGLIGTSGLGGGNINNAANNSLGPNSGLGLVGGNNVSNSGGLGGGMGSAGNPDDGNGGTANNVNSQQAAPQYTIPGILHFIQHEWSRFELERSQWDVDRAELQVSTIPCCMLYIKNKPFYIIVEAYFFISFLSWFFLLHSNHWSIIY